MADDPIPLDYLCPVCGEQAVAGSHFCGTAAPQKTVLFRQAKPTRFPRGAGPLVALVGATLLSWPWIGPWSLLVLAFGAATLLVWVNRRR